MQVIDPDKGKAAQQTHSPNHMQILDNPEVDDEGFQQVISKGTKNL